MALAIFQHAIRLMIGNEIQVFNYLKNLACGVFNFLPTWLIEVGGARYIEHEKIQTTTRLYDKHSVQINMVQFQLVFLSDSDSLITSASITIAESQGILSPSVVEHTK